MALVRLGHKPFTEQLTLFVPAQRNKKGDFKASTCLLSRKKR